MDQKVNVIYSPIFTTSARYIILMGGRGAGRSTVVSQYILSRIFSPDFFRCAIMREVFADIRHSIWQEIQDRINDQEVEDKLHLTDNDMAIEYGENSIKAHGFRQSSAGRTAKLKSLASYNTVVIEEAEEVGEAEFTVLDDTLRTVRGDIKIILCLNSPPKNHWIIKRWFDLKESKYPGFFIPVPKKTKDMIYITGTFWDNAENLDSHTIERYQQYQEIKPDYYHQMIEGLVPEVVRGRIYSGWRKIKEVPKEARLVRFGLDFGWFPDPAALGAIYYWNGAYIVDELAYGNYLSNEYMAGEIKKVPGYEDIPTIADSAEPKSIEEMRGYGIKIEGSEKGADSVNYGIQVVSQKPIYITERSKNVWEGYENYAWAEDKDGNPKGEPSHLFSHAMDMIRYPLCSIVIPPISKNVSSYTPRLREFRPKTRIPGSAPSINSEVKGRPVIKQL